MRGKLYFNNHHIFLTLKDEKEYILFGKKLETINRNTFQFDEDITKDKVKLVLCESNQANLLENIVENAQDIEELNEEETWNILKQLINWTRDTETLSDLPILEKTIDRNHHENSWLGASLSSCFRLNTNTSQISTLTFNRNRKEFKPRNVRIGYVFERINIGKELKQRILQEWEAFIETTQETRIEILESTQKNWRYLYHPELTPVKSCMTYLHLYTKVAAFYMTLPTKPVLIFRKNTPIARTILWEEKYYDRIYTCSAASQTKIVTKLEQEKLKPVQSKKLIYQFDPSIIIKRRFVPYLDTMYWFSATSQTEAWLSNHSNTLIKILREKLPDHPIRIAALCSPSHKERYNDVMRIVNCFSSK